MATGPKAGLYQNAQSTSYLPPTLIKEVDLDHNAIVFSILIKKLVFEVKLRVFHERSQFKIVFKNLVYNTLVKRSLRSHFSRTVGTYLGGLNKYVLEQFKTPSIL